MNGAKLAAIRPTMPAKPQPVARRTVGNNSPATCAKILNETAIPNFAVTMNKTTMLIWLGGVKDAASRLNPLKKFPHFDYVHLFAFTTSSSATWIRGVM